MNENERDGVVMVIANSNVSVGSSHDYSASQNIQTLTKIGNEISYHSTSFVYRANEKRYDSSTFFKDTLKAEMNDEAGNSFENSLKGMKTKTHDIRRINSSDYNSNKKIREETIMFLLRLLFNRLWRKNDEDFSSFFNQGNDVEAEENVIGSREMYYEYYETEETTFFSTGSVVTADGRTIDFDFSLTMSRSFSESYFTEQDIVAMNTSNLIDPLVINLDSNAISVSDQKFYFDIDSDGVLDCISQLNSGSGYLALDKNEDGMINDGSELFGTKSGNGFMDLSRYDSDGNGWIDENDEVFKKLMIWTKDENGNDVLYHLKDKNIGALCLSNVDTSFSLKSIKDNLTNGVIRKTGVFLYENGNVGSMQQIDLAR